MAGGDEDAANVVGEDVENSEAFKVCPQETRIPNKIVPNLSLVPFSTPNP
jgi:hypothetical protein